MKTKHLLLLLLLSGNSAMANPPAEEGKKIFVSRCAACHTVNKIMTGPALAGVEERHSLEWIMQFVRSSQSMVKSGDKNALALYEQFNKVPMPDHPDLTDDNIKDILTYIKSQTSSAEEKPPFAKPGKLQTPYTPLSISKDYGIFIGFLSVVGILMLILLFAVQSAGLQRKLRDKQASFPE